MQTSEAELHQRQETHRDLHQDPQQLTLPLEMFRDKAGTSASGTPGTATADAAQPQTCNPREIWKTLAEADRKRVENSWMQTMREVLDERGDR